MKMQKRKALLPIAGMLCVGLFGTLSADQPQRPHQDKAYGPGKTYRGGMQKEGYQRESQRMITPNAGPKVSGGMDFFVSADYILWRVNRGERGSLRTGFLDVTAVDANPALNSSASTGKISQPLHDLASGFKVAIGMDTSHDGFDVRAGYTWNRFRKKSTFNGAYINGSTSLNIRPTNLAQLNNSFEAKLDYNKVDLELGRDYKLSPKLSLRTHAGLTGTWQLDRVIVRQNAGDNNLAVYGFPGSVRSVDEFKTWGIGPRIGSNFFWAFIKDFGIYSNVAVNALWREVFDSKLTVNVTGTADRAGVTAGTAVTTEYVKDSDSYGGDFVSEFELGLRYQALLSEDRYRVLLQAGWETQNWIGWGNGPDMSYQGLNVRARVDF